VVPPQEFQPATLSPEYCGPSSPGLPFDAGDIHIPILATRSGKIEENER
jgi:hypothetical protein